MRPVGFMMATKTLPRELLGRAPDQDRLLVGWRTGSPTRDLRAKARRLKGRMDQILPDLKGTKLAPAAGGREIRLGGPAGAVVTPPA